MTPEFLQTLMSRALLQAQKAESLGEVPVGAVIAYKNEIIAEAHNLVETEKNATRHAEMIAIEQAIKKLGNFRLLDCVLFVTLEPCTMCAGAIMLSRIPVVIFGASDPRMGAFGSVHDVSKLKGQASVPKIVGGVQKEECEKILKDFFIQRR